MMAYTNGVTSSPLLQTLMTGNEGVGNAKAARGAQAGASVAQDRTQLSTAASALHATATDDAARASKVAALKSAVARGTYHVPAAAVADKLVQSMLQS